MPKQIQVWFEKEKETRNTIKFREAVTEGEPEVIGSLYVQKHALKELGYPTRLKVTVEDAE